MVALAAILGDSVGYEVGRLFGPRVVRWHLLERHEARLASVRAMLRDRGGPAVFLGRFTAFFRAVMPGLAGLSEMRYPKFLLWNTLGGMTWGIGFCLVGYFAGASYKQVAAKVGTGSAVVIGRNRRRRAGRDLVEGGSRRPHSCRQRPTPAGADWPVHHGRHLSSACSVFVRIYIRTTTSIWRVAPDPGDSHSEVQSQESDVHASTCQRNSRPAARRPSR